MWPWEGGVGAACEEGRTLSPVPSPDSQCLASANVQKESKENQWLGVSVRSQGPGGKIVVSTTPCRNDDDDDDDVCTLH